jgi:very-short-patch-repair endonuclease
MKSSRPSPFEGEGKGEGKLSRARHLRKSSTEAERHLWRLLRARQIHGLKFRRQHPIGPYIADFYCATYRLIIEVDGGQHAYSRPDDVRTRRLNLAGYRVLRFWNHDVLTKSEAVLESILLAISHPHPTPLPERERESGRGTAERLTKEQ